LSAIRFAAVGADFVGNGVL